MKTRALLDAGAWPGVLVLNGGSSSIRFVVYEVGATLRPRARGKIDRVGLRGTNYTFANSASHAPVSGRLATADFSVAARFLLEWLEAQSFFSGIVAVGHRVVHGMKHSAPQRITSALLAELRRLTPYDSDHLPGEIALIEEVRRRHPRLSQVACFDTAFHRTMPRVARLLPIPRHYAAQGVVRYGFHGLSYAYLMEELARLGDSAAVKGRVILAHLGNGASLAAVRDGRCIDTSMGFTPAGGLMMSTRSGDLDPGLLSFLARRESMSPVAFDRLVNHESGLRGISGTSSDVRDLLAREARDARAAEALAMFCYQARKWIGSYAAALGGVDTLVFSGGIGENAPQIRARICAELGFLGVQVKPSLNARNAPLISPRGSPVAVHVIRTDEELMIARAVGRLIGPDGRARRS